MRYNEVMYSNHNLVDHLIRSGVLRSDNLIRAFEKVDRADFVRPDSLAAAYEDYPLPIGFGQTISQPYTVAFMLEMLHPRPEDTVLDIGSGSGWTTALLAQCAKKVIGLERVPELVSFGQGNLAHYHLDNASISQAGNELGIPGQTFNKILVSAAAEELPQTLIDQLSNGGILVIPVRHAIIVISKDENGQISRDVFEGFVFVPLL